MKNFHHSNKKHSARFSSMEEFIEAVKAVEIKENPGKGILGQVKEKEIVIVKKLKNGRE
jgi:hypothetical protein